ncbi:hypothetical protein KIL84_004680 [Mauremys mutica]|uniref:Uncharacterized protein n=1 Tax=Mauremys mutica TaxID=74926 RepID=A0A9D3XPV4_9SAUR|nr:hypothetical protein KIL84_004680 [Mauremys mutica]
MRVNACGCMQGPTPVGQHARDTAAGLHEAKPSASGWCFCPGQSQLGGAKPAGGSPLGPPSGQCQPEPPAALGCLTLAAADFLAEALGRCSSSCFALGTVELQLLHYPSPVLYALTA